MQYKILKLMLDCILRYQFLKSSFKHCTFSQKLGCKFCFYYVNTYSYKKSYTRVISLILRSFPSIWINHIKSLKKFSSWKSVWNSLWYISSKLSNLNPWHQVTVFSNDLMRFPFQSKLRSVKNKVKICLQHCFSIWLWSLSSLDFFDNNCVYLDELSIPRVERPAVVFDFWFCKSCSLFFIPKSVNTIMNSVSHNTSLEIISKKIC